MSELFYLIYGFISHIIVVGSFIFTIFCLLQDWNDLIIS